MLQSEGHKSLLDNLPFSTVVSSNSREIPYRYATSLFCLCVKTTLALLQRSGRERDSLLDSLRDVFVLNEEWFDFDGHVVSNGS